MFAFGPDIKDGQVIDQMDQVDHYNAFCHLLNLEPKPNNGTTEMLGKLLNNFDDDDSTELIGDDDDDDDDNSGEDKDGDGKPDHKQKKNDDDDDDDDDDDNGSISQSNWITIPIVLICTFVLSYDNTW